jgi:hypothetical protein
MAESEYIVDATFIQGSRDRRHKGSHYRYSYQRDNQPSGAESYFHQKNREIWEWSTKVTQSADDKALPEKKLLRLQRWTICLSQSMEQMPRSPKAPATGSTKARTADTCRPQTGATEVRIKQTIRPETHITEIGIIETSKPHMSRLETDSSQIIATETGTTETSRSQILSL